VVEGAVSDFEAIRLSGSNLEEFGKSLNAASKSLPPPMRKRFLSVFSAYFGSYGLEGAYQRMNERTIGQILSEFQEPEAKIVASGELDGMKYTLYDTPHRDDSAPDASDD
jgi:hypothetical protein